MLIVDMYLDRCYFSTFPTSRLNHDPAMTGQKPGRTIRSFAKRIGEGVQSSTMNVACATRERNLARRTEDISGSNTLQNIIDRNLSSELFNFF